MIEMNFKDISSKKATKYYWLVICIRAIWCTEHGVLLGSCGTHSNMIQVHWCKNIWEFDTGLIECRVTKSLKKEFDKHWDILFIRELVTMCYLNFLVDTSAAELSVNWLQSKQPNMLLDMWPIQPCHCLFVFVIVLVFVLFLSLSLSVSLSSHFSC